MADDGDGGSGDDAMGRWPPTYDAKFVRDLLDAQDSVSIAHKKLNVVTAMLYEAQGMSKKETAALKEESVKLRQRLAPSTGSACGQAQDPMKLRKRLASPTGWSEPEPPGSPGGQAQAPMTLGEIHGLQETHPFLPGAIWTAPSQPAEPVMGHQEAAQEDEPPFFTEMPDCPKIMDVLETQSHCSAFSLKGKIRAYLEEPEPYNVTDLYKRVGCWQAIARNQYFENLTLLVIIANALWFWVDTDLNTADTLIQADLMFQIMENLFCLFFTLELIIRFMAFRIKKTAFTDRWFVFDVVLVGMMILETWVVTLILMALNSSNGMRGVASMVRTMRLMGWRAIKTTAFTDRWFVFDVVLVGMMILETWVLTLILMASNSSNGMRGLRNASMVRTLRLLRMARMVRIARLLRAVPELVVMLKGIAAAIRSVMVTLVLLALILYVFGVSLRLILNDTDAGKKYFFQQRHARCRIHGQDNALDEDGAMARMARLLRAVPELLVMIKGIVAAIRSVVVILVLLALILYVFGVSLRLILNDTDAGKKYFSTVANSMLSLVLYGIIMDNTSAVVQEIGEASPVSAALIFVFILLASFTVLNMLVGVMCETVHVVSERESEIMNMAITKERLWHMLRTSNLDADGNEMISKDELKALLQIPDACIVLRDLGVDVLALVDAADVIFEIADELDYSTFMQVVMQMRNSNTVTVRDLVMHRRYLQGEMDKLSELVSANFGNLALPDKETPSKPSKTSAVPAFRESVTFGKRISKG
eukprot:CAMPEP_0183484080 /NCGR_PEP_ID=MMETSP0370-20130417/178741_1 /TAXON_ID=268820 /ORGANISM="Peridinium aciculiferum, Strain PAER-2" /LENGTH=761 /DNA_ID=CAMNT_0025677367 /DNA_START=39 /DNA_END=2326 /DNA_ORIENTATION=-